MSNEKTQTITIPCYGGETLVTEALVIGPFAIHQTQYGDGSLAPVWTLTHLPSGKAVTQECRSERAARQLAAAIEPLTDWTVADPTPAIRNDPDKLAAVRHARVAAIEDDYDWAGFPWPEPGQ